MADATADVAFHRGDVGLVHLIFRMHDVLGQLPVIGHEDEPFGVVIEAAHVEDPFIPVSDDVPQSPSAFGIVHGG